MSEVRERYSPLAVGVDTTVRFTSNSVGGFACKTSGTITIVNAAGTTIVNAHPVTAGVYHPFPFYLEGNGASVTTASGASGVLAI